MKAYFTNSKYINSIFANSETALLLSAPRSHDSNGVVLVVSPTVPSHRDRRAGNHLIRKQAISHRGRIEDQLLTVSLFLSNGQRVLNICNRFMICGFLFQPLSYFKQQLLF